MHSVISTHKIGLKTKFYHLIFKNYLNRDQHTYQIGYFLLNLPIELKPSLAPQIDAAVPMF